MSIYVTPENQKLLWSVLHKNPLIAQVFSANQIHQKELWFKTIIENFFNQYRFKTLSKRDLQQLNQDTLNYMIQQLREHLSKSQPAKQNISVPSSQNLMIDTPPIPQNNRQDLFNNQFQQRQKDYEQMSEKKAPDTIDFRDKVDDEPISNMDELIRTHMQMRENELKQYSPPPPNALPVPTSVNVPVPLQEVPNQPNHNITTEIKEIESVKPKKSDTNTKEQHEPDEMRILREQMSQLIKKMVEMQKQINSLIAKSETT
jgi:hypothetical protein